MDSLHNYYVSTILELERSTQKELVVNYVAIHIIKRLQIVQFIESVKACF
jgi:hypothetical protein